MKEFFVYFMTNHNNKVLYVGVSSNLEARIWQHKNKMIEGFTEKYNVTKLVYFEPFSDGRNAIQREKQIKNWNRPALISSSQPEPCRSARGYR